MEYWDVTLTPTIIQVSIIFDLIRDKYFDDTQMHPAIQSDYQFVMDALSALGDTRWLSAEDLINALIQFPNMEDFTWMQQRLTTRRHVSYSESTRA